MNVFHVIMCIFIGIMLGYIVSVIGLLIFKKYLIKNITPCCAKCLYCKEGQDGFVCTKKDKIITNLLFSGKDCDSIKME